MGTSILDCIEDQGSLNFICTNNFDRGTSGFAIGDDAISISNKFLDDKLFIVKFWVNKLLDIIFSIIVNLDDILQLFR